jgi:hypothetical protein
VRRRSRDRRVFVGGCGVSTRVAPTDTAMSTNTIVQ